MKEKFFNVFRQVHSFYKYGKLKIAEYCKKHMLGLTLGSFVFLLFIAMFWNNIFISIDSGQQGIRWSRVSGTKVSELYGEGLQVIWPWDKMYIYETRLQTKTDTMHILTAEGLTIRLEFSYRFFLVKDSIPTIHKVIGPTYANTFVKPEVQAASISIIGNYTPEQLYKMSTLVIQSTIKHYLNKRLVEKNIVLDDYLIRKLSLPENVANSIEKKMIAEQLNYEFDYRIKTEEKERQRKIIEAEGIRKFEEISKIPILKWKGLEVTSEFARSQNSKIVIMGSGKNDLPLLLNSDDKK